MIPTEPKRDAKQVKFWDYYIYERGLFEPFDKPIQNAISATLEAFRCNDYKSAHVKRLEGVPVSSMRLNDEDRLIFDTIEIRGLKLAFIHGVILKHRYLDHPLLNIQSIYQKNDECQTDLEALPTLPIKSPEIINEIEPSYFSVETLDNDRFIDLTPEQYNAIQQDFPLFISGGAGSGKTLTLIKKLQKIIATHSTDAIFRIECITESEKLVFDLEEKWSKSKHNTPHQILFLTYSQWISRYAKQQKLTVEDDDSTKPELVGDDDLNTWYANYIDAQNKRMKAAKKHSLSSFRSKSQTSVPAFPLTKSEKHQKAVKQTFKMFAGVSPEDVPDRNFLFPIELKSLLIEAYNAYLQHLGKTKLHPAFFEVPTSSAENRADFTLLDEAQNFNFQQIKNVFHQTKPMINPTNGTLFRAISINYDSHQNLNTHYSDRDRIIQYIERELQQPLHHIRLKGSHRSPLEIRLWADLLYALKYFFTCGKGDEHEDTSQTEELQTTTEEMDKKCTNRHIDWPDDPINPEDFHFKSGRWLVITHACFLDEAIAFYGNALTFDQVIGLESEYVCLHRPFDHPEFREMSNLLPEGKITGARPVHEAKRNKGDNQFNIIINSLISGTLRTKSFLLINQNKKNKELRRLISQVGINAPSEISISLNHSNLDKTALDNKIRGFILTRNEQQAILEFKNAKYEERFQVSYDELKSGLLQHELPNLPTDNSIKTTTPTPLKINNTEDTRKKALKLYNEFTEKNLNKLLNSENICHILSFKITKKAIKIDYSLLEHIFKDQTKTTIFCSWLKLKSQQHLLPLIVNSEHIFPVHTAAKENCVSFIEMVVQARLSVDEMNTKGVTPFYLAIKEGHTETVKMLQPHVNIDRMMGTTSPLLIAVETKKFFMVCFLIKHKIPNTLNMVNQHGETALILATKLNHRDIVKILLEAGADKSITTPSGDSAYIIATQQNFQDILTLMTPVVVKTGHSPISVDTSMSPPLPIIRRKIYRTKPKLTSKTPENTDVHVELSELFNWLSYSALELFCGMTQHWVTYLSYLIPLKSGKKSILLNIILDNIEKSDIFCDYLNKNPLQLQQLYDCYIDHNGSRLEHIAKIINCTQLIDMLKKLERNNLSTQSPKMHHPLLIIREQITSLMNKFNASKLEKLFVDYTDLAFMQQKIPYTDRPPESLLIYILQDKDRKEILYNLLKNNFNNCTHKQDSYLFKLAKVKNFARKSMLHLAAEHHAHNLLNLLLETNCEIDQTDIFDCSPLMEAITYNNSIGALALLKAGANVNLPTPKSVTLLHLAFDINLNIFYEMLEHANETTLNAYNENGDTILTRAIIDKNVDMVNKLMELSEVNFNLPDRKYGYPPIYLAAHQGNLALVLSLLSHPPVLINQLFGDPGECALGIAIQNNYLDIAQVLIQAGADVNKVSAEDLTPLMLACLVPSLEGVKLLLENGADVSFRNIHNKSALTFANEYGYVDIGDHLCSVGANPLDLGWFDENSETSSEIDTSDEEILADRPLIPISDMPVSYFYTPERSRSPQPDIEHQNDNNDSPLYVS